MMGKRSKSSIKQIGNEQGIVLVIALIMLCMMTIIGTAVTNTTSIETMISGVERDTREAFYVGEAGVDHMKGLFKSIFIPRNSAKIASGLDPDWDFALDGSESGISAASGTTCYAGATWIYESDFGEHFKYTVRVWNNSDGGGATDDTDGVIYIRSTATSSHGVTKSVEVSVYGTASGTESVTGYVAQAGAGSGKAFTSEDAEAISDFTQQI